jgi:hypothetical protein
VLLADGVKQDFEAKIESIQSSASSQAAVGVSPALLDYIHRRDGEADIYFVANPSNASVTATCSFRVAGKAPELWDAVTGERRFAAAYREKDGRTVVPLELAPYGSWFVIFRVTAAAPPATATSNTPKLESIAELTGPWTAHFPRGMSTAERDEREMLLSSTRGIVFDPLASWTTRSEPGIKFYSGSATYLKSFVLPDVSPVTSRASRLFLDLGHVRELADVRVNGKSCGIVWAPPFRVDITEAMQSGTNHLTVEVVNFWPNRIIGDAALPPEKRLTKTNIRKLAKDTPLMESGLLGPVRVLRALE